MKEKRCPICGKPVRSDALVKKACSLCGMLIDESKPYLIYSPTAGKTLYFCCERCSKLHRATREEDNKVRERTVTKT